MKHRLLKQSYVHLFLTVLKSFFVPYNHPMYITRTILLIFYVILDCYNHILYLFLLLTQQWDLQVLLIFYYYLESLFPAVKSAISFNAVYNYSLLLIPTLFMNDQSINLPMTQTEVHQCLTKKQCSFSKPNEKTFVFP